MCIRIKNPGKDKVEIYKNIYILFSLKKFVYFVNNQNEL